MTRAAVTKLLILVILAFIICLPEFFTVHRASKVTFHCLPYRPCERGTSLNTGGNGKTGDKKVRRKDMCDPQQAPEPEKWEHGCPPEKQSNVTGPVSDSRRGSDDLENSWFICNTDMDMAELHSNNSLSALTVHLEVSVELLLREAETLNLTLYGRSNHSSLHLHPPEEYEEEEDEEKKMDVDNYDEQKEQRKAFYCCLPVTPPSGSANQSSCLLWLANQTVLSATAKEKLPWKRIPKDEWWCVFRVLWLALLCLVLLMIVTIVLGQIYSGKHLCEKPMVHPIYDSTGRQLNDGGKHTEIIISKGLVLHPHGSWSGGLSPIQEVDSQDDIETLLDGNEDHCFTANLHHRVHPSTSSLTEEQACRQTSSQRSTHMDWRKINVTAASTSIVGEKNI